MEGFVLRGTSLTGHIISFCRYLRGYDYIIGPDSQSDALQAMTLMPIHSWDDLCNVLKLTLPKNKKQVAEFDKLFYDYWHELDKAVDSKIKSSVKSGEQSGAFSGKKPSFDALKNWLHGKSGKEQHETAFYSDYVSLYQKDFSTFTTDELWELKHIIRKIAKSIVNRKMRRFVPTTAHKNPDLRRILRNNLKRGGEMLDLYYKKPKETDLQLVILCDVSKSMELYSRFLIQFLYAFQHVYSRIETFLFNTSLHHVSGQLGSKNFDLALKALTNSAGHWAGGTKIGKSLHTFIQDFGGHHLNKKTVIVIVSDGWDTGDILLLEECMQAMYHASGKLIWLNPLAGAPDFKPVVAGMKSAMDYVDILAPVHNIESLKKLPGYLLSTRRKRRLIRN